MIEMIGGITMNLTYYSGQDLYSEGDVAENEILELVKRTENYDEELLKSTRWINIYQLLRQRENIIEPMDIKSTDTVLEIGAGMGAVTGAIARRCKKVDCIDLSKRRSLINAYRNKKYENIELYVGNFQDIRLEKQYDVITLIGVLEYAQHYINSIKPYDDFIKKIATCLKPGGKLYVAIENKLGLKYFAGCCEDHLGRIFCGLEGYSKEDNVKTFSKSQLEDLLLNNGFNSTYFYYPYPDYKLPEIIYSDDYLPSQSAIIPVKANYLMDRICCFDESKVYRSLANADELKVLSNSFLVEAIRGE